MIKSPDTLAYVYLHRQDDEKNQCVLTASRLTIIFRGKTRQIPLEDIRNITFGHKLLLFPIVAGGSFGPFFFIALLENAFLPIISLLGFLASIFLLYYGFSGKNTLRVELTNDIYEIFLPKISNNLKSFARFVIGYARQNPNDSESSFLFYIPFSTAARERLRKSGTWKIGEEGVFGIHYADIRNPIDRENFLEINLKKEKNIIVKYENDEKGNLRPKLFGEISAEEH